MTVINNKVSQTVGRMMGFDQELKRAYRLYCQTSHEDLEMKRVFGLATERAFELAAEWLLRTCNLLYTKKEDGLVADKLAPILGVELAQETSRALEKKLQFGTGGFSSVSLMDYLSENILIFSKVEAKLRTGN